MDVNFIKFSATLSIFQPTHSLHQANKLHPLRPLFQAQDYTIFQGTFFRIFLWSSQFPNGLFGWHRFGFEWVQIQILCLDKLKELNLNLAQIHLGFQGSKSMDLKFSHKPKNLEIPHLTLALYSQYFIGSSNCHALSSSICSASFSLSCSKVCLSTLFFLFILSISLSSKSES